ncbi:MAG: CC0125/CC1285 family lipoprotein [Phenylobacterium sp.]
MSRSPIVAATAAALVLAAGLGGCVSPTPYQPLTRAHAGQGGYSETRIEPDRWRVTFAGNAVTSRETVEGYLLYRAAELTLQNGSDWFAMVDRQTDRNARTYVEPDPFYHPWYGTGFTYWRPAWRYRGRGFGWRTWDPFFGDPFFGDTVDVHTIENFEASAEIVTHKGAKPADDPRAFDAHAVAETLKPKIVYPVPKGP